MQRNGLEWPEHDTHCYEVAFDTRGLDLALKYTRGRRTVIQAGGNCGAWPKRLSSEFATVYTFEPHPENFGYLVRNVPEPNVVKLQAALGCNGDLVSMDLADKEKGNIGAYYVKSGGIIPTLSIDDLRLRDVDLIYLDIEGAEMHALLGATSTITRYKPVIALEMNGLSTRYGFTEDDVLSWLAKGGYSVAGVYRNDRIFVA